MRRRCRFRAARRRDPRRWCDRPGRGWRRDVLVPGDRAHQGGTGAHAAVGRAQYVWDVASGNANLLAMLRSLLVMLFNKFQAANRRFLPGLLLIKNGKRWPFIDGRLTRTPTAVLDLGPGSSSR